MTSFPEMEFQFRFDARRADRGMSFFPIPDTASCRTRRVLQFRNPPQVIRRGRQISRDLGSGFSDETGLSHSAHRFQPAENLFNPLSFALADLVALGAGRPSIEARCLAPVNTGDMWLDLVLAQMPDEVLHVVTLATHNTTMCCGNGIDRRRGHYLSMT